MQMDMSYPAKTRWGGKVRGRFGSVKGTPTVKLGSPSYDTRKGSGAKLKRRLGGNPQAQADSVIRP